MDDFLVLTKADTLLQLKEVVKKSYIEDCVVVHVSEVFVNFENVYAQIIKKFAGDKIVIRSSLKKLGQIHNDKRNIVKNNPINFNDKIEIEKALKNMALMYADNDRKKLADYFDEQILIQRYSENIVMDGVAYTRDFIYKRPYYMINYEEKDDGKDSKTKWIAHNISQEFLDYEFLSLINAIKEIEDIYSEIEALEIKFGIDSIDNVIIYQVRPLVEIFDKPMGITDREFMDAKSFAKCGYLDNSQVLSDMTSFKPAEILGLNPRPLDCSLFKELMAVGRWSEKVDNYNFDFDFDIMHKVGNKPYISVSRLIEELTPEKISGSLKFKLNEFYIKKLKANHYLHERLEYDLILNCYDFSTKDKLKELFDFGFSKKNIKEISDALYEVTSNIINTYEDEAKKDLEDLAKMIDLRHEIRKNTPLKETNIMKVYKYVNDLEKSIEENCSFQYIRHMRYEVFAKSLLRSLEYKGYFTKDEIYKFISSIETVETKFEKFILRYIHGEVSTEEFNELYGHLRLKPCDIRTDCYKFMKLKGIFEGTDEQKPLSEELYNLDEEILKQALEDADINITPSEFISLISDMIKNKAVFNFELIKSLSLILDMIVVIGNLHGIDREDMSYLEIQELISYHSRDSYIQIIQSRRDMYHAYTYLVLPEIIFSVGDIDVIDYK